MRTAATVVGLVALVLLGLSCGDAQVDTIEATGVALSVDGTLEAEHLGASSGRPGVVLDSTASAGRALAFYRKGSASIAFESHAPLAAVVVRVRGESCLGAPRLVVTLDGKVVLDAEVPEGDWAERQAPLVPGSTSHQLSVAFPDDEAVRNVCDRNLVVDRFRFSFAPPASTSDLDAGGKQPADGGGGPAPDGGGGQPADGGGQAPDGGGQPADGGGQAPDGGGGQVDDGGGVPAGDAGPGLAGDAGVAPAGRVFYVDAVSGSDTASGTSASSAWRTLQAIQTYPLLPGDQVLLRRGQSWTGTLKLTRSGSTSAPIVVGAFGAGAPPVITGGGVNLSGSDLVLEQVQVDNGAWAGVDVYGARNTVRDCVITHNVAGVFIRPGALDNKLLHNELRDNNRMSVNTPGGDDDSGAFGVLLQGDGTEVAWNKISGSDAFSYDYGRDGAAVEVYGAKNSTVHHNEAWSCDAFTELGNSRSADNTFAYNTFRSSNSQSIFLVTRGAASGFGPVNTTRVYNNTVLLTGASSQGFVCHAGCNGTILTMRNNVIQAVLKAGYADGAFDEDYDLFSGPTQFSKGPHSLAADPKFVDPAAGDLHLRVDSQAVDTGSTPIFSVDLDGVPIPADGNGDGLALPDRGAYERH